MKIVVRVKYFDGLGSDDDSKKMVVSKFNDLVKCLLMFYVGLSLLIDSLL